MILKDFRYIIKRIIIGVGIAIVISVLRGKLFLKANAETFSTNIPLSYISLSSTGYGSNSGSTLPRYQSYGNYLSTTFYNGGSYIMTSGNSYYVYYVVEMVAQDFSVTNGIQFFVQTSNGNVIQATPDREEYYYLYHTGTNTYTVVYMFGIDSTVNVTTWSFQFNYSSSYNANFTQSGVTNATLTVVLPDSGSSGGGSGGSGSTIVDLQPVIINQIQNTQTLINNQNSNTQSIINNQNSNTQDIIDNQNQNADDVQDTINDNLQTCIDAHSVYPTFIGIQLNTGSGRPNRVSLNSNNSGGVVDVSKYVGQHITITFNELDTTKTARTNYCFTSNNASSTALSCISSYISGNLNSSRTFSDVLVPEGAKYLYLVGYNNYSDETWVSHSSVHFPRICTNKLDDINDTLNDDNVDTATSNATSFFDDFTVNTHGLSGIITSPLRLINSLSSSSCSSLSLPLPFVNQSVVLPCMSTIYSQHFSSFLTLYRLITDGIISYWVLIKIFGHIKGMQSPDDDRIEVLDL